MALHAKRNEKRRKLSPNRLALLRLCRRMCSTSQKPDKGYVGVRCHEGKSQHKINTIFVLVMYHILKLDTYTIYYLHITPELFVAV